MFRHPVLELQTSLELVQPTISNGNVTGVTITNTGVGFTGTDLPDLVIDPPHSYTNIPLIYSGSSVQGVGQSATIDIQVGAGGSVIDYQLQQEGFIYGNGEILTVPVGGGNWYSNLWYIQ